MPDLVLAALIAATGTITASFLQVRAAIARELASRSSSSPAGRRKSSRAPFIFMSLMLAAAAFGGFTLSQWLTEHERAMQSALLHELQARVATLTRTESQLREIRAEARAEIEAAVLRKLGVEGVAVTAMVGPCKSPLLVNAPTLAAPTVNTTTTASPQPESLHPPAPPCTEADASPVTLCATVPATAAITDVELFMRPAEQEGSWSTARVVPGAEVGQARFAEKPVEVTNGSTTKEVCQSFASWSTERAREARLLVRYSM